MNAFKMIIAFLLGIGAGVVTGYLTAPRSGKETADKLKNQMDEAKKKFDLTIEEKLAEAKKAYNDTLDHQATNGKKMMDKFKHAMELS